MAAKNDIDITIGGKTFTLSGVESEAYLREVAAYLNGKLRDFSDDAAYWRLPNDMRNVMLQLNLADDFFKERNKVLELEAQVQEFEGKCDRLNKDLEKMQEAAGEAASRIRALEAEASGLRDQAQRSAAAETSATKRLGAEKSRAGKMAEEMDALRKSKAEADKAVERLRNELAQTRESLQGELNRTKTDLEQRLAASEAKRKKEVQEIQALRQREVKDIQTRREKDVKELKDRHQQEMEARDADSAKTLRERESSLERALSDTKEELSGKLQAAEAESAARQASLDKAADEIKKLRSQLDIARLNGENTGKKLAALEKEFDDRLTVGTEKYRAEAEEAREALEKTREELTVLQEQENIRLQAAGRVRATMQELVQQYGRFGQSLEEAAGQLRALEE